MVDTFDLEFTIGPCRINRLHGTISNADGEQHVTPKAMDVLICLARNAGELVTRENIEKQVWGSTQVSDDLVTHNISELRRAFDDHPERPEYIQTVPKRGYRLVAPVKSGEEPSPTVELSREDDEDRTISLWQELQRRKVIRTAIAYAAVGWLLIQFADTVFGRISEEITSIIIALIILGFPIALVLAWMIERTKSGAKFERNWIENKHAKIVRQKGANVLMAGVSVLAVVGAGYILTQSRVAFTFESRDWVVVSHLDNLTDDPVLDESLDRAFRIRLGQSGYVNLLPDNVVRETLLRMQQDVSTRVNANLGIEIALREDARAVISPSVANIGDKYNLMAEIIDPARSRVVATRSVTADSRHGLLDALESLVDLLRADLGEALESGPDAEDKPLERVTTRSLEALNAYSIAVQQDLNGNYQAAIDLLHRAIELDDEFATAYSMLGVVLMNTGHPRSEFEPHWAKAMSLEGRLGERERLHIQATNSWLEEPTTTERAWMLVANVFPDDATAHHNLGIVYLQLLNQGDLALARFERAASLPSTHKETSLIYLGFAQMFAGRVPDAVDSFESAWNIGNNPQNFALADGYVASFQYDKAKQFLDDNDESLLPIVNQMRQSRLVIYFLDRGELQSALRELEYWSDLFTADRSRPPLELQLIRLGLLEVGANSEAFKEQLRATLTTIGEVIEADSPSVSSYFYIIPILRTAAIASRNGEIEQARSIYDSATIRDALTGHPVRAALHDVLGAEVALADGDHELALALLGDSLAKAETFEAHVVLARVRTATGDSDEAKREFEWVMDRRGRAFAEWHEDLIGRELNILRWSDSAYHLARIYEASGENGKAEDYYSRFIRHWQNADADIPALADAIDRRRNLQIR